MVGSGESKRGSSVDTVGEGGSCVVSNSMVSKRGCVVDSMVSHRGGVHERSWECGCQL